MAAMSDRSSTLAASAPTQITTSGMTLGTRIGLAILAFTFIMLRIGLWRVNGNSDLQTSFIPWQTYLIEHGRWRALSHPISDYFPAYFDLTVLTSYFDGHLNRAVQIKLISFCFDLIAAAVAFFLVRRVLRERPSAASNLTRLILGPFCILAGPTVIINGSMWGQSDIVYTTFLLLSVLAVIEEHGAAAVLFFGFALALKLQAVFLVPFLGAMLLQRRVRWYQLLLTPVGWLLALLPAIVQGGNPLALLKLPSAQGTEFRTLAINIGNPWLLAELLKVNYRLGVLVGLALTVGVTIALSLRGSRSNQQSGTRTLLFAAVTLLTMPYIMPKMHERYLFPAEVCLCLLSCVETAFVLPAALVLGGSLIAYTNYFLYHVRYLTLGASLLANTWALVLLYQQFSLQADPAPPK
jgi:Gpi18-like mannosyltransferase